MNTFVKKLLKNMGLGHFSHIVKQKKQSINTTWTIFKSPFYHRKALLRLKQCNHIRCVYMVIDSSSWKYNNLYHLMIKNERFDPLLLICPVVNNGKRYMLMNMEETYQSFKKKGYNVIKAYDEKNDKYVSLREDLKPDLLAYTNPYKGLIDDRYYITNFPDILTFYVPYGFNSAKLWNMIYCQLLTNVVWRYYVETDTHQDYAKKYSLNKGINTVVTGYPGIDELIDINYSIHSNPWGNTNKKKKIIWAPHHTIEAVFNIKFSNFLRDADFMLDIAKKYSNDITIAFKPHPLLKNKLYKIWGEDKTNTYYLEWGKTTNTFLHEGEYTDLFLNSDAMIHDSGSFLIEYLYTNKPVMRIMTGEDLTTVLNDFALQCLTVYYKAYSQIDIEHFIQNVINGIDPLKERRTKFVNNVLMPKGSPSQNILNDLIYSIDNGLLFHSD